MRQVLRRLLPAAAAGVLLTGCAAEVVTGQASPGPGEPVDVAPDAFPITGVSDSGIDSATRAMVRAVLDSQSSRATAHATRGSRSSRWPRPWG